MIKKLIKLANDLDIKGLSKEADYLDAVIRKYAIALELGNFEDLAATNITKDEAFDAGHAVCEEESKTEEEDETIVALLLENNIEDPTMVNS
jgi:hypothetical protein